MITTRPIRQLLRDTSGISSILAGISLTTMIGVSALAIDLGSIYLAKRDLQGLADAAAMALDENDYVGNPYSKVQGLILKDGAQGVRDVRLVPGHYEADPAINPEDRFKTQGASSDFNAIEVQLSQDIPLFFGTVLTGRQTASVNARAIATKADMAAFSIGTRISNLTGDVPHLLLASLAGRDLGLDAQASAALAGERIDVLAIGDMLASEFGLEGAPYSEIFSGSYPVNRVLAAIAESASDPANKQHLEEAARRAGNDPVQLDAVINLGPTGKASFRSPEAAFTIDGYALVRTVLQLSQGETYRGEVSLAAAGLGQTRLIIAGNNATASSPLLTINAAREVVLRTAATRVYLETSLSTPLAGIASVNLPIYAELAPGEARMTQLDCSVADRGVTLAVRPAIGSAAIGSIDTGRIEDFSSALPVSRAELTRTALFRVTALSDLRLGGDHEQSVRFDADEIAAQVVKSVQASDAVQSLAASLVSNASIEANAMGLGVNAAPATSAVGSALLLAAPALDSVLYAALESAGVKLGVSDVSVTRLKCGVPMLVG